MDVEITFEELLDRVRQGDEQASTDLVQQYEPEVRRFVRYRLNSPKMRRLLDTLDICQSVFANFFVRVTGGQFNLQHPRQLQQLLLTMASNKLLDNVRKQGTARRGGDAAGSKQMIENIADKTPGPAQAVEVHDMVDVLRSRLAAEERNLLDQWLIGDDWPLIAGRAGASPEAVRKRFTRAVDRVAQELGWEVKT